MRTSTPTASVRRAARMAAALAAVTTALSACSSSTTDEQAAPSSAEVAADQAASGSEAPSPTQSLESTPEPASTAASPSAYYPPDPNEDPIVELGPPPPAYQVPRAECPPEAKACVDLTNNMTWMQVDGAVIFGPVQHIAGRQGYQTTPGMHSVSWKNIDHVSSIWDTPMPYAIFFTSTGMAFHEGELNIPSHGCVHLTHEAAVAYWDNLKTGDKVYVFGEAQY